jgi:hypothetical protein
MLPGFQNIFALRNIGDSKKDLQAGVFMFFEEKNELYFQDAQEKMHDMSKIYLLSDEWNLLDGNKKFPKPFVIGSGGEVKEFGAFCLYSYLNSSESNIVVFGQIINPVIDSPDNKLDFKVTDLASLLEQHHVRNNEKRYYSVSEDGQGNLIVVLQGKENNGNFYLKLIGDDNQANGNVKVELNGKFVLNQVTDEGEVFAQIMLDNKSGNEKIRIKDKYENFIELNKTGTIIETPTIRIGKTETVAKIMLDLITAILNMTQPTAAGGPTMPQKFNQTAFEMIKNRINNFMDKQ